MLRGSRGRALLLERRFVDRGRTDSVLGARDEKQGRPVRAPEVDLRHGLRIEVRVARLEERPRRTRDVVAVVHGIRALTAQSVREAPVELLARERHGVVLAQRIAQRGPRGSERRERQLEHPFRRGSVERDRGRTETAVGQELRDEAAERVADDDRRLVEAADDPVVVVDDVGDREPFQRRRISAELLGLCVEPGPGGRQHLLTLVAVALPPVLPAQRRHPHAVNQDDRAHCASLDRSRPREAPAALRVAGGIWR